MKFKLSQLALILIAAFTSQQALAACTQAETAGLWYFNGLATDGTNGETEALFCKIRLSTTGGIIPSASSCGYRANSTKGTVNITGGKLNVNQYCLMSGIIRLTEANENFELRVDNARLDSGKSVITLAGVGEAPDYWNIALTGVRNN